jgi:HAD superfamily hydrolase (TIGR01450 family)
MDEKLKKVKCFLLDMDGTIYLDETPIEGAIDAVERMRKQGRVIFLTNNSSVSRADYVAKLNRIGFRAQENDVFSSSYATIEYLNTFHKGKKVYFFANEPVKEEFRAGGIKLDEQNPDIIVVGFNTTFCYDELERLCDLIRAGVPYICTHADVNCPTMRGYKPDVGSFIALIEKSTGIKPTLICGKPFKPVGDSIKRILGLNESEIAMFGDRLATDVKFAVNNAFVSVLVMSGEAKEEDIAPFGEKIDVILPSIADWDK